MDYIRRIHCHYCGDRSPHTKASKVTRFHCRGCDAWNYFDSNGQITDTPVSVVTAQKQAPRQFNTSNVPTHKLFEQSPERTFCSTCEHNQRVYLETLSNYLPDDDDPRYKEYEKALPKFKADLEKRYPQICKKCAPKAQTRMYEADYFAGTQNVGKLMQNTQRRRGIMKGQRDDWYKRSMRAFYGILGMVVYASLVAQCTWHVYGFLLGKSLMAAGRIVEDETVFDATPESCAGRALQLRFSRECYMSLAGYVLWSLRMAVALVWFNPGRKFWYDGTVRMAAVDGQRQYFFMQCILLAVRIVAFVKLSDSGVVETMSSSQLLAAHGFMVAFMLIIHSFSNRLIKPVIYRHRFKITPKPDETDIFADVAGPGATHGTPRASSIHPDQLFAHEDPRPFPIWNLAPKTAPKMDTHKYPSPPMSSSTADDDEDDADAMDVDWRYSDQGMPGAAPDRTFRPRLSSKPQENNLRSIYNHGTTQPSGWGALRSETFRLQDRQAQVERQRQEEEQKARLRYQPPVEQSPFRGRLPQAPMSMERRLRNPVTQVQFKKTPLSKQQNFMKQMRDEIDNSKIFAASNTMQEQGARMDYDDADDTDTSVMNSPAIRRTKGNLELKQSTWRLPTDGTAATGLEDLFGGASFRIADEPIVTPEPTTNPQINTLKLAFGLGVPLLMAVVSWAYMPVRRAICLWLVGKLDDFGVA